MSAFSYFLLIDCGIFTVGVFLWMPVTMVKTKMLAPHFACQTGRARYFIDNDIGIGATKVLHAWVLAPHYQSGIWGSKLREICHGWICDICRPSGPGLILGHDNRNPRGMSGGGGGGFSRNSLIYSGDNLSEFFMVILSFSTIEMLCLLS